MADHWTALGAFVLITLVLVLSVVFLAWWVGFVVAIVWVRAIPKALEAWRQIPLLSRRGRGAS
jgi:hypothetical protein